MGYWFVNLRHFLIKRMDSSEAAASFKARGFLIHQPPSVVGLADSLSSVLNKFLTSGECESGNKFTVLSRNDFGVKSVAVDLNSPFLFQYVFTKSLYELIHSYYGRGCYLRNNPTIEISYDGEVNDAQKFHIDWGLNQISVMFNLSDLKESSTHMVYMAGSNQRRYFWQPDRDSVQSKSDVSTYLMNNPECIVNTIGPKDTVSIFDAGNGFHRQVAGSGRIMLHLNIVENFAFTYWDLNWLPAADPGANYWFSKPSENTDSLIRQTELPEDFFALVFQRHSRGLGVPRLFSKNARQ